MYFNDGDVVTYRVTHEDFSEDTCSFTVLGDEVLADGQLMLGDDEVLQVLAVGHVGGRIGVAVCTESEIEMFLPGGNSSVSFDDVLSHVDKNGEEAKD
jgi:hypothetical protein